MKVVLSSEIQHLSGSLDAIRVFVNGVFFKDDPKNV